MSFVLHPWQFWLIGIAGWINPSQQETMEDLRAENQMLREDVGNKRILLHDDQQQRLAVNWKVVGLVRLREVAGLFTPKTILRWHRRLVARKWDYSDKRVAQAHLERFMSSLKSAALAANRKQLILFAMPVPSAERRDYSHTVNSMSGTRTSLTTDQDPNRHED